MAEIILLAPVWLWVIAGIVMLCRRLSFNLFGFLARGVMILGLIYAVTALMPEHFGIMSVALYFWLGYTMNFILTRHFYENVGSN